MLLVLVEDNFLFIVCHIKIGILTLQIETDYKIWHKYLNLLGKYLYHLTLVTHPSI